MNARDIIKLAAKLYIDDYLKKKTTILANAEKGKDINTASKQNYRNAKT